MGREIEIRQLMTMEELYLMQEVEEAVWQVPPIPVHQTYTSVLNGGLALGAFIDDKMIGFQYSFAGFDGKDPYLCSHMLGILPAYRKDGLGVRMKMKQAEVAKQLGYKQMNWTFDPLESVNAYVNLHKLQATGAYYLTDHYGTMEDGLNKGMPTDRIKVVWRFDVDEKKPTISFTEEQLLVGLNADGIPSVTEHYGNDFDTTSVPVWFVAIPDNIQQLKIDNIDLAIKWRYETRKAFELLFKNGYQAIDLIRSGHISYYCFTK